MDGFLVMEMLFSTQDRDNDQNINHCSIKSGGSGGMWYNNCARIYFNGKYPSFPGQISDNSIIRLKNWRLNLGMKNISMAVKVKK